MNTKLKNKYTKKVTQKDVREHFLLSNGMIHMAYKADCYDDLVSHYSQKGNEVISPQFSSFFDSVLPSIPLEYPVVTEITGCEFASEEKKSIEDAVWNYYNLKLSKLLSKKKNSLVWMMWFALSLILASYLLFFVRPDTDIILTNFAYLPFWFFGYRLITYFILEYIPQIRDIRHCSQMAGMKVVFSGAGLINNVPEDKVESYSEEIKENLKSIKDGNLSEFARQFIMEDGIAKIVCGIETEDDIVQSSSIEGYEMVCEDFSSYISNAIPFIPDNCPVSLNLKAPTLSEEEKAAAERAVRTHFTFKTAEFSSEVKRNTIKIAAFAACFILSILLLSRFDKAGYVAVREFITMLFWFFGDYLVEFVLLEHRETISIRNKYLQMLNMDIDFID